MHKNVGDLGKLIVAKGVKKLPNLVTLDTDQKIVTKTQKTCIFMDWVDQLSKLYSPYKLNINQFNFFGLRPPIEGTRNYLNCYSFLSLLFLYLTGIIPYLLLLKFYIS